MIPDDPAGAEDAIAAHLLRLERAGHRTLIEMGPYSAFMVVGMCQDMARRFPTTDIQGDAFEMIGHNFDAYFEGTAAGDFITAQWQEIRRIRQRKEDQA